MNLPKEYLAGEGESWKELMQDPRMWIVVVLTITMSASVTSAVERYTGLKFNRSEESLSNECVVRALHEGEFTDSERLAAARICVPKPKE